MTGTNTIKLIKKYQRTSAAVDFAAYDCAEAFKPFGRETVERLAITLPPVIDRVDLYALWDVAVMDTIATYKVENGSVRDCIVERMMALWNTAARYQKAGGDCD